MGPPDYCKQTVDVHGLRAPIGCLGRHGPGLPYRRSKHACRRDDPACTDGVRKRGPGRVWPYSAKL